MSGLLSAIAKMTPYGPMNGDGDGDDPYQKDLALHSMPLPASALPPPAAPVSTPDDSDTILSAGQPSQPQSQQLGGDFIHPTPAPAPAPQVDHDIIRRPPASASINPGFLPENHPMSEQIPGMPGASSTRLPSLSDRPSPRITMPDMSTMPSSDRVQMLQHRLDDTMSPHLSLKDRLLHAATTLGPGMIAMAMSGSRGARQGAAQGVLGGQVNAQTLRENKIKDLEAQAGLAQRGQETEYGTEARIREAEAQMENNRLLREAMIQGQNTRAQGRDDTSLITHGYNPTTQQPNAALAASNQAKLDLMKAQKDLAAARASGEPQKLQLAQKNFQLAQRRVAQGDQHLALDMDKFDYQQWKDTNPDLPTAATKTKIQQASGIKAVGDDLTTWIGSHKDLFGPVSGRWNNVEAFIGDQSPEAQEAKAKISSYAALHPALHGFRGAQAFKEFFNAAASGGISSNADAIIGGIRGMTDNATTLSKAWRNPTANTPPARRTKPGPGGGAPTRPSAQGQPKVGDVKVFPNGKRGVWDGQGYVAQ